MKLVVENVGRIEKAEIEIRPLTVFVGENGTNKTWVAHGLFKMLERFRTHAARARSNQIDDAVTRTLNEKAKSIVERARATPGEASFKITRSELVNDLPSEFRTWLAVPHWESAIGFTPSRDARLTLQIQRDRFSDGAVSEMSLSMSIEPFWLRTETFFEGVAEPKITTDYGDTTGKTNAEENVRAALETLLFGWRRRVRVLPVEREFLAQAFSWLTDKESQDRLRMPRALVDFCFLMNEPRASRTELGSTEHPLSSAIHNILGGRFRFEGANRELVFKVEGTANAPTIPVQASASLGKSLVGLDIFLWSAGKGDIVIIDEPEMNAHPEAQVKLVELFALMIRAGIQLVLITHSPYIVDHISTLVEMSRLDENQRKRAADSLALKQPDSYLKPEEVAVWQFGQNGTVTSIYDQASGSINWSTFTDVTRRESLAINRILDEADRGDSDGA